LIELLAFLPPLAIYLLILGAINRRRHPLMVPGPWDFAGLLFAASGFLLCTGPGALSLLNDQWRQSLVLGDDSSGSPAVARFWLWWLALMVVYFALVVGGAGFFLWRARNQTSIYNVDREMVREALARIFERLGLRPLRSGDMYYFGMTNSARTADRPREPDNTGIQTTPDGADTSRKVQTAPAPVVTMQNVILELDAFPAMCHVTLRWDPARSGLRQEVERELERELADTPAPPHMLGGWLTVGGCGTFLLMFLVGFGVLVYRILHRM
jgi:hypothetical protein